MKSIIAAFPKLSERVQIMLIVAGAIIVLGVVALVVFGLRPIFDFVKIG